MVNCPTCMKEGFYNVPEHIYAVAKKSAVAFLRKILRRTKIVLSVRKRSVYNAYARLIKLS